MEIEGPSQCTAAGFVAEYKELPGLKAGPSTPLSSAAGALQPLDVDTCRPPLLYSLIAPHSSSASFSTPPNAVQPAPAAKSFCYSDVLRALTPASTQILPPLLFVAAPTSTAITIAPSATINKPRPLSTGAPRPCPCPSPARLPLHAYTRHHPCDGGASPSAALALWTMCSRAPDEGWGIGLGRGHSRLLSLSLFLFLFVEHYVLPCLSLIPLHSCLHLYLTSTCISTCTHPPSYSPPSPCSFDPHAASVTRHPVWALRLRPRAAPPRWPPPRARAAPEASLPPFIQSPLPLVGVPHAPRSASRTPPARHLNILIDTFDAYIRLIRLQVASPSH
ncbi:hypothetical protein D9615_009841 [Tricholomella constricta]|uniref:Uncharacterized protein n=1 Tax=Tricholomella constricta TaxID=117010 RepID=A0A8H5LWJ7_9AGAR|nr:hypothetical protein D9615_009841 [Tricholomella constricta]